MAIPGAELEIELRPNDQGLQDAAERWARELGEARGEIEAARKETVKTREATDALRGSWELTVTGWNQGLELLGKMRDAAGYLLDAVNKGAQLEALSTQFDRSVAGSSQRLVELREASQGALDDDVLKRFALLARNANVTADQTQRLVELSTRLSAGGFGDVAEISQELLDTVVGASDSNLEKLGIVFDLGAATEEWARQTGRAGQEITKVEQSQAALAYLTDQVAKRFGDIDVKDSTVLNAQRLRVEIEGVQEAFDRQVSEAGVAFLRLTGLMSESRGQTTNSEFDRVAALMREIDEGASGVAAAMVGLGDGYVVATASASDASGALIALRKVVNDSTAAYESALGIVEREARARVDAGAALFDEATKRRILIQLQEDLRVQYGVQEEFLHREQRGREALTAAIDVQTEALIRQQTALALQNVRNLTGAPTQSPEDAMRSEADAAVREGKRVATELEAFRARLPGRRGGRGGGSSRDTAGEYGMSQFLAGNDALRDLRAEQRAAQAAEDAAAFDALGAFGADADESIRQVNAAREAVDALANSFTAFGTAYQDSFAESLRQTGIIVADEVARVIGIFDSAREAGLSTGQAVGKMVPGALNAAAGIVKAVGGSVQAQEVLYGLSDTAMAATRYAFGDIVGGTAFAASAGLHFYAAAAAGQKSGGSSGAAPRAPGRAPVGTFGGVSGGSAMTGGTGTVQINFSGATIVGPGGAREAGRAVTSMVAGENRRGSRSAEFQAYG